MSPTVTPVSLWRLHTGSQADGPAQPALLVTWLDAREWSATLTLTLTLSLSPRAGNTERIGSDRIGSDRIGSDRIGYPTHRTLL